MPCCCVTAVHISRLNYTLCGYFAQVIKHRRGASLSRRSGMSEGMFLFYVQSSEMEREGHHTSQVPGLLKNSVLPGQ